MQPKLPPFIFFTDYFQREKHRERDMSGNSYRRFVRILERWPVDKNKQGNDIGEALRQLFSNNFPSGSASKVNEKMINK